MASELRTAVEAAQLLRVKASTLQYWRSQKIGPRWTKLGRRVMYDRADLERFIEASKVA